MKIAAIALAAAGLLVSSAALAQSAEDLIKKNGCAACHSNDKKIVGPAYIDVAAKYKGDASAVDTLTSKLKDGKGHPKIAASDAEIKAAIEYVLSQ